MQTPHFAIPQEVEYFCSIVDGRPRRRDPKKRLHISKYMLSLAGLQLVVNTVGEVVRLRARARQSMHGKDHI